MEFVRRLQECRDIHGGTIKSILVIGDSDQSIYAFRNAVVDNFNHFEEKIQEREEFANDNVDHFNLVNNYRSTSNILTPANEFVSKNEERVVKQLVAANGPGEDVTFKGFKSWDEELAYCIEEAKKVREDHPDWTICFMTRNKKNLANVSQALSKAGQTWVMKAPMKLCENTRVIAATNLFECFSDDESTQGIFDYLTVVNDNHFKDLPEADQLQAIEDLRFELTNLRNKSAYTQRQRMHELLDSLDKDDELYIAWKDIIYQEALLGCQKEGSINNEPFWIYESIRKFKLYGQKVELKMNKDYIADFILTTAHSSKGLEYDCVFCLMDDFDNHMYHKGASSKFEVEEERRLIFVAMTRAKKLLYCTGSYVVYKNDFEGEVFNQFLQELYVARDGDSETWEGECMAYRQAKALELEERRKKNNEKARQRRADKKAAIMASVMKGQMKLSV
jgi:DNA helicase-2/ATP-dependent DNA helicase PcrA